MMHKRLILAPKITATALVVASNAGAAWPRRGPNVYVCDGVADNVQIQAAIGSLPAAGGLVRLSEGQFNIAAQVNLNTAGIVLVGQGTAATVLKLANTANVTILRLTKSDITVRDLTVDGNKANNTSGRGIDASDAATVVAGGQESRLTLSNLKIYDTAEEGLDIENSVDLTLYWFNSLYVTRPGKSGIVFIRMAGIMGNGILSSISPPSYDNIYIGSALESSFTNTISDGSGRHGIILNASHKIAFVGGYLGGSVGAGFYFSGDYFSGSRSLGFTVSKMFFNGNGFNTPAQSELVVAPTTEVIGVIITDNQFSRWDANAATAILLSGKIDRAIITGNSFEAYQNHAQYTTRIDRSGDTGSGSIIRDNQGYVTENSGAATVANGTTTKVVAHGLAAAPTRVLLTARLWSSAAKAWVTTIGATNFTINVDADPGAGTAIFDWRAQVGEG